MACEICGRNMCTRSFHSLEEQDHFDSVADDVKERAHRNAVAAVDRLEYIEVDGVIYVSFGEVIDALDCIID